MATKLQDKLNKLSKERQKAIEARTQELICEEMTLRDLRKAMHKTQVELSKSLHIQQDGISHLENRSDMLITTLGKYIKAMGGTLKLTAEFPDCPILLSDEDYKTTTKEELIRYLSEDTTNDYPYISEWYDCNNFSYTLMGRLSNPDWGCLPFGILWTDTPLGGHAVNCFVDYNRDVWIVEPQSDEVFELPDNWEPWIVIM